MSNLVSIDDLKKATGYKTAGHVESWLQRKHIPYFRGKQGRLVTTIDKINEALDGEVKRINSIDFGYGPKA